MRQPSIHPLKTFVILGLFVVGTASLIGTVSASVVSYSGTFSITGTGGAPEFVVGDKFNLGFSVDHSVTDNIVNTSIGNFIGAVTTASLTSDGGNSGSWDPSGATWAAASNATTFQSPDDRFEISSINGTGVPGAGGSPFVGMSVIFDGAGSIVITDTGSGQSLFAQFGNTFFDPSEFPTQLVNLQFTISGSEGFIGVTGEFDSFGAAEAAVPEPST